MYSFSKKFFRFLIASSRYSVSYYNTIGIHSVGHVSFYSNLLSFVGNKEELLSPCSVNLYKETKRSISKRYGKPLFMKKVRFNSLTTQVSCHKQTIGGEKITVEVHYYKSKPFYKSYHFRYLTGEARASMIDTIGEKYSVKGLDVEKHYIRDSDNSSICFRTTNGFQIKYIINTDFIVVQKIQEELRKVIPKSRSESNGQEIFNLL